MLQHRDRLLIIALGGEQAAQLKIDGGVLRGELVGGVELLSSTGALLGLQSHAEMQVSRWEARFNLDSCAEVFFGAGPVFLHGVKRAQVIQVSRILRVGGDSLFHAHYRRRKLMGRCERKGVHG